MQRSRREIGNSVETVRRGLATMMRSTSVLSSRAATVEPASVRWAPHLYQCSRLGAATPPQVSGCSTGSSGLYLRARDREAAAQTDASKKDDTRALKSAAPWVS